MRGEYPPSFPQLSLSEMRSCAGADRSAFFIGANRYSMPQSLTVALRLGFWVMHTVQRAVWRLCLLSVPCFHDEAGITLEITNYNAEIAYVLETRNSDFCDIDDGYAVVGAACDGDECNER